MSAPRPPSAAVRPRSARRRRRPSAASPVHRPHPAFVIYQDIASARDALEHIARGCAAGGQLQPMLWRLDQVASGRWRDMALRDAVRAQTVVLALRDLSGFDAAVDGWLTDLSEYAGHHGQRVTVLALLGRDDPWSISLEPPARDGFRSRDVAPNKRSPERPDRIAAA